MITGMTLLSLATSDFHRPWYVTTDNHTFHNLGEVGNFIG